MASLAGNPIPEQFVTLANQLKHIFSTTVHLGLGDLYVPQQFFVLFRLEWRFSHERANSNLF
jgi:hypothetical protein